MVSLINSEDNSDFDKLLQQLAAEHGSQLKLAEELRSHNRNLELQLAEAKSRLRALAQTVGQTNAKEAIKEADSKDEAAVFKSRRSKRVSTEIDHSRRSAVLTYSQSQKTYHEGFRASVASDGRSRRASTEAPQPSPNSSFVTTTTTATRQTRRAGASVADNSPGGARSHRMSVESVDLPDTAHPANSEKPDPPTQAFQSVVPSDHKDLERQESQRSMRSESKKLKFRVSDSPGLDGVNGKSQSAVSFAEAPELTEVAPEQGKKDSLYQRMSVDMNNSIPGDCNGNGEGSDASSELEDVATRQATSVRALTDENVPESFSMFGTSDGHLQPSLHVQHLGTGTDHGCSGYLSSSPSGHSHHKNNNNARRQSFGRSSFGSDCPEDNRLFVPRAIYGNDAETHLMRPVPVRSTSFVRKRYSLTGRFSAVSRAQSIDVSETGLRRIIHGPSHRYRVCWDLMGALLIVYDLLYFPMRAFGPPEVLFTEIMDKYILVYWTVNMPLSLIVGYVKNGQLVKDPKKIFIHYLKTWFIIDLIVVLPDWIFTVVRWKDGVGYGADDGDESAGGGDNVKLFRILRFFRTVRLLRLVKLTIIMRWINDQLNSEYSSIFFNIVKMITSLLFINHFIACIWYWLTTVYRDDSEAAVYANWVDASSISERFWTYKYMTSFHWSLTQFTPASMDVQPQNVVERTFANIVVVFALVGFSYLVGSITGSLTQLRSMQEQSAKQFWNLRRYLRQHNISRELSSRVNRYLEHAFQQKLLRVDKSGVHVLSLLSEQLSNELQCEMSVPHMQVHPLFQHLRSMSKITMDRLANTAISRKSLARGDSLFFPGELATHMYFVIEGRLEYDKSETHKEFVDKHEDWIAEPILWTKGWTHLGLLLAMIECELLLIDPVKFGETVVLAPPVFQMVCRYAHIFLGWLECSGFESLSDITQGEDMSGMVWEMIKRTKHEGEEPGNAGNASAEKRGSMTQIVQRVGTMLLTNVQAGFSRVQPGG